MDETRPMTLDEYIKLLPEFHIARIEYERLVERGDWLQCLEAAGVDNWPGIDEAREIRDQDA